MFTPSTHIQAVAHMQERAMIRAGQQYAQRLIAGYRALQLHPGDRDAIAYMRAARALRLSAERRARSEALRTLEQCQ